MLLAVACWACGAKAEPAPGDLASLLHQCPACGFAFQPQRGSSELHALYGDDYFTGYHGDQAYDADDSARIYEAEVRARLVQRYLRSGRLLEIGCASGHFLAACRRRGFDVTGVEVAGEIAETARERFGVDVIVAPLEDLDLGQATFDAVCGWHVLEHVPDPLGPLQRVARALRPEGWFFVEVPNFGSARARREGLAWPQLDLGHHVGQYSPRSLRALLERAGLRVSEVSTVPWGVYRRWPRRLVTHANQGLKMRSWPVGEHRQKHDLLRAAAQMPV